MEPAELETWAHEFRAKSKCLGSTSSDEAGEISAAIQTLQRALPKLGEASPLERKCFLVVLQGLRNTAALANHLLADPEVMQLANDTIESAARMTISGIEVLPVAQSILKTVAQLLANLANGPHTGHAVFQAIWPDALLKLALANAPGAHEAACQTLYNCCRDAEDTSAKICATGGRFFVRMLRNCLQLQHEATNAALALLIACLVWTRGHLALVLTAMHAVLASEVALEAGGGPQQDSCTLYLGALSADSDEVKPADTTQSMDVDSGDNVEPNDAIPGGSPMDLLVRSGESSCLLHLLTHEMVVSSSVLLGALGSSTPETLGCLVGVLRHCLAACVDEREHIRAADAGSCRSELEGRIGKGRRCCAALVLEASLRFLATLLSRDELANCGQDVKVLLSCDLGLPSILLQALACLPKMIKPPSDALDAAGVSAQYVQEHIQGSEKLVAPRVAPYPGYRADLLAVIGNLAHGHTSSQNAIAACGGVELVLAQSHFSVTEPVVREWALWAVRNLCEGNAETQERVRNLKVQTSMQDEALEKRSQQVEIDQLTGKLKLVDLVG